MRKLVGLLLAAFGLAFGYMAYENAPSHREDQLAAVTRILTNPGVDSSSGVRTTAASSPVKPAPATPQNTEPAKVAKAAQPAPAPVAQQQVAQGVVPKSPPQPAATSAWQTSVQADAQRPGATAAVSSAAPGDSSARYELVKSLQAELKRVGCYSGETHGNWTSSSKRAMSAFMERVNATLPIDRPDYIQLTLLQNQKGSVCGRDCPRGQAQAGDGRCVPEAILAHSEGKAGRDVSSSPTEPSAPKAVAAAEQLPWASKLVEPAAKARDTAAEPYVTAAIPEAAPPRPSMTGRMSVGGPLPTDVYTGPSGRSAERVARLETPAAEQSALAPAPADDDAVEDNQIDATTGDPAQSETRLNRKAQTFAALATEPVKLAPPKIGVQPRQRIAVQKFYAARVQKAASRPQRPRAYGNYRQRTVQNLFTHPLGRM